MGKQHNTELSMMRGICTLLVIMVHLLANVYNGFMVIFTCYILLVFFFLSGYFIKTQPVKEQLKKRLWALGKPFLIYFFAISLGCGLIIMIRDSMDVSELCRAIISELFGREFLDVFFPGVYLKTALHRPLTVSWFFVQLILATAIAIPVLGGIGDSVTKKTICAIACMVISSLLYSHFNRMPFQLQMLFFEVAVVILGNIAHQYGLFTRSYIDDHRLRIVLIVVIELLSALLYFANPTPSMMSHGQLGSYNNVIDIATSLLQTIAGMVALYEISVMLRGSVRVTKALEWVGSHSLEYVFMHLVFAWLLSLIGIPLGIDYVQSDVYSGSIGQMAMLVLIYFANIGLCTLYVKLIDYLKENRTKAKSDKITG